MIGRLAAASSERILAQSASPSAWRSCRADRRPRHRTLVQARIEQVRRQAHMNGPAPPGEGDTERLADVPAKRSGVAGRPRRFRHRLGHLGLAQFLKSAASQLPGRGVPRQQNHRRFRRQRRVQSADRIGVTGSAGNQGDTDFSGQAAMGIGHVHGGGLMADVNEVDAGVERGVEDRHDVVAGQREHAPAAKAVKRASNNVGAAQGVAHRLFGFRGPGAARTEAINPTLRWRSPRPSAASPIARPRRERCLPRSDAKPHCGDRQS